MNYFTSEQTNLLREFFPNLTDSDIECLLEASHKLNEDPSFDYEGFLTKGLYNTVGKTFGFDMEHGIIDDSVRETIHGILVSIADIESVDKLKEEIGNTIDKANISMKDAIDIFKKEEAQHRRMMEETLLEKAEQEDDIVVKQRMIDTSHAFTNGYKLTPLKEYILSDEFASKYRRASRRFSRLDTDFSHAVQKQTGEYSHHLSDLKRAMHTTKNFKFSDDEIDKFCVALGLYARYHTRNYKPDVWFLYCVYENMMRLCTRKVLITEFDKEKIKYLIEFFKDIETN